MPRAIRPGFLKAIDKALEVLPENRIQTADEWLEAIVSKPILSRKTVSRVTSRILDVPEEDTGRKAFALAAAFAVAGVGLAAALWFGPTSNPIANSPFEVLADAGPLQTIDTASPIAGETAPDETVAALILPSAPVTRATAPLVAVETLPTVPAALLPAPAGKTELNVNDIQNAPRAATIRALPLEDVALVSLPPAAAIYALAPEAPSTLAEGGNLDLALNLATPVEATNALSTLSLPLAETLPQTPGFPAVPNVLASLDTGAFVVGLTEANTVVPRPRRDSRPCPGVRQFASGPNRERGDGRHHATTLFRKNRADIRDTDRIFTLGCGDAGGFGT